MTQITYTQQLDEEGNFKRLGIHQGNNAIYLSLRDDTFGDGPSNDNWTQVKRTVESIKQSVMPQKVQSKDSDSYIVGQLKGGGIEQEVGHNAS